MGNIFDFSGIKNSEHTIKSTWNEFRDAIAGGLFGYSEIDKAKQCTFLKVYDDLFDQHDGITLQTTTIRGIITQRVGRGAILREDEVPNYERFIPKKEFIKQDNRFSPPGIEWLYLALGDEKSIHECAQAECRVRKDNRFGFCHFEFNRKYDDCKLVDLTIADNISYHELNQKLEDYGQTQVKRGIKIAKAIGINPRVDKNEFAELFTKWGVYTYAKLLSEQIFIPLNVPHNKKIEYAPFQTMAQYYISLGYSGIIFGSTVCSVGKNIVLFDKAMAHPTGKIEISLIS